MPSFAVFSRVAAAAMVTAFIAVAGAAGQDRRHPSGQSVTPSFDGWFKNSDGTFTLVFGYFNRNFEEEVDIPVGPNNRMEPGPEDRGQPTHFLARRQFGIYPVRIPADFGKQTLTWTLVNRGGTFKVPGYLRPEWEITPFIEMTTGDKPPFIKFEAAAKDAEGPVGTSRAITASAGGKVELAVWASSRPGEHHEGPAVTVVPLQWSLYRGAPRVTFSEARPKPDKSGRAVTTATFTEPGEYTLRLLAGQADTTGCCWTNGFVKVIVSAPR